MYIWYESYIKTYNCVIAVHAMHATQTGNGTNIQPRSAESRALGHGRITAQVHVAQRRELPCEQQKDVRDLEMKPQSHATSMRSPNEGKLMGMKVPSLDSWNFHGKNHGCIDLWNIYGGYVELVIVASSTYLGGVTWKGSDHMSGWISPKTTEGLITRLKMTLQMGDVQIKLKIEPWKIWYTYYPTWLSGWWWVSDIPMGYCIYHIYPPIEQLCKINCSEWSLSYRIQSEWFVHEPM